MDDYYKQAGEYFAQFEGRKFFPGLKDIHWYLWLVSLTAFTFYAYEVFIAAPKNDLPYWQMVATEAAFLLSCILIAIHRFKSSVRSNCPESDLKPIERLGIAKRQKLEELLGRPADQFITIAKEIIELRTLEKTFRSPADPDLGEIWKKVFDKDSKARIISIFMSIVGLIVGLIGKIDNTNLLDKLSDASTQKLLLGLIALAVSVFFLGMTTYILVQQLIEVLSWLASALWPSVQNNKTTLNYLIRDLIKYYRPALEAPDPAQVPEPTQPPEATVPDPKPYSGLLLAVITAQAAYAAWKSTQQSSLKKPL